MRGQSLKAFVLRTVRYGENRRLLEFLTEDGRLLTSSVRDKDKRISQALTQAFTLGEFEFIKLKDRIHINSGQLLHAFLDLQNDWERLASAAHLSELFCDGLRQQERLSSAYPLWAYSMQELSTCDDPMLQVRAAQFRFLCELGFTPWCKDCVICHKTLDSEICFNTTAGGLCCERDAKNENLFGYFTWISQGTKALLQHLIQAPIARLFNYEISDTVRKEFIEVSDHWCQFVMEKEYTRLRIHNDILIFSENIGKNRNKGGTDEVQ